MSSTEYRIPRERMIREQLLGRGLKDKAVLEAMLAVPRHLYVPEAMAPMAYDDRPLPIGHGQTISQPFVVAWMCSLLQALPGMSVLEVGTGSGYQAAVLQAMGLTVFTVERLREHYLAARERFSRLRLRTVRTCLSDGTMGWPEMAPFDRIIVAAGGPDIPQPLVQQLGEPGLMILPVGKERGAQTLVRVKRESGRVSAKNLGPVSFVDLVGSHGWAEKSQI